MKKSFFFFGKPKKPAEADPAVPSGAGEEETARRRLDFVLNTIHEGVLAVDSGLTLLAANPRARDIFGIDRSFCFDRSALSLLEAARSTELEKLALLALSQGAALTTEMGFYAAGEERRFAVSASPLPEAEQGGGWAMVLVFSERTHLRKLERVRKDFAANVSHELKTPIQVVKGFAETLLDNPLEEPVRQGLEIILKNALVMENLTGDLLCLLSLEEDRSRSVEPQETPVRPLLEEARSALEVSARNKGITLFLTCAPDLSAALHGRLMVRGMINLLDNAIKYSPAGSRVWAEAKEDAGRLVITVRDQGAGIPAKDLPRIFERFYRVDSGRPRDQGGAGLGLAIVRHIARVHHGAATAESHAGEGSIFTITVPLRGQRAGAF